MANLTISWTAPNPCVGCTYEYRYKLSTDTTFITGATSNTSVSISSLTDGATYNYGVRTVCGDIRSAYSTAATVTCNSEPPLTVTPTPTVTATPTPTPTNTPIPISMGLALEYNTAEEACAGTTTIQNGVTYTGDLQSGTILSNFTEVAGNTGFFKITSNSVESEYVGQILGVNDDNEVIDIYDICNITPTPTPTSTATPTPTPTPTPTSTPVPCVDSVTFQVDSAGEVRYVTCEGTTEYVIFGTGLQSITDCIENNSLFAMDATISSVNYGNPCTVPTLTPTPTPTATPLPPVVTFSSASGTNTSSTPGSTGSTFNPIITVENSTATIRLTVTLQTGYQADSTITISGGGSYYAGPAVTVGSGGSQIVEFNLGVGTYNIVNWVVRAVSDGTFTVAQATLTQI